MAPRGESRLGWRLTCRRPPAARVRCTDGLHGEPGVGLYSNRHRSTGGWHGVHKHHAGPEHRPGWTVQKEGANTTKIICFVRFEIDSGVQMHPSPPPTCSAVSGCTAESWPPHEVISVPTGALVAQSPAGGYKAEPELEPEMEEDKELNKPKRKVKTKKDSDGGTGELRRRRRTSLVSIAAGGGAGGASCCCCCLVALFLHPPNCATFSHHGGQAAQVKEEGVSVRPVQRWWELSQGQRRRLREGSEGEATAGVKEPSARAWTKRNRASVGAGAS